MPKISMYRVRSGQTEKSSQRATQGAPRWGRAFLQAFTS
jgi:hypothetical protein